MDRLSPRAALRLALSYDEHFHIGYALGKLATDPLYAAVADRLLAAPGSSPTPSPVGLPVLDLGCGIGLSAFYLRTRGYQGPILGVEPDTEKVHAAKRTAAQHHDPAATRFEVGDGADPAVFAGWAEGPGHVLALDVLHYFDPPTRQAVLKRMIAATAPGGLTILRVTLRDASWRYRFTLAEERAITKVGWIKGPGRHFPEASAVTGPFEAAGFEAEVRPLWGKTPFNSYLYTFRRPMGG